MAQLPGNLVSPPRCQPRNGDTAHASNKGRETSRHRGVFHFRAGQRHGRTPLAREERVMGSTTRKDDIAMDSCGTGQARYFIEALPDDPIRTASFIRERRLIVCLMRLTRAQVSCASSEGSRRRASPGFTQIYGRSVTTSCGSTPAGSIGSRFCIHRSRLRSSSNAWSTTGFATAVRDGGAQPVCHRRPDAVCPPGGVTSKVSKDKKEL